MLASGLAAEEKDDEMIVYRSPTINSIEDHESCTVHQGDDITLIACDNGYELYETNQLVIKPHALKNYGEKRPARVVNSSLVTGKGGHLTYLLEGRTVVSAYYDKEHRKIVKDTLLNLALTGTDVVSDLFVFDDVVATKIGNEFRFWPYPLAKMNYVDEVPLDMDGVAANATFNKTDSILAYTMIQTKDPDTNAHIYDLYALLNTTIAKISYQYHQNENKMTYQFLEKNLTDIVIDGNLTRVSVSLTDFILSCADCSNSSV